MLQISYSPTFLAAPEDADALAADRWIDPRGLDASARRTLKAEIDSGELQSILFWATMFGDEPNINRVRPVPGKLEALRPARPIAFVRDHSESTSAIIGRVESTRVVAREGDGVEQLQGSHRLNDPDAMRSFVDGNMTDFSVLLLGGRDLRCSLCEATARRGFFGSVGFECECEGAEVFIHDALTLAHNSWVTEGAYRDSGLANSARKGLFHIDSAAFGSSLAGALNGAIDGMSDPRAQIIERMGSAAGIEASTVNQILSGSINCPPIDRLTAFARVLSGVSASELRSAAESDGCTYNSALQETPTMAEENTELTAALARACDLEAQLFEAKFKTAISERRVMPSERARYDRLAEKAGVEFAIEDLSARLPMSDLSTEPVGRPPTESEGAAPEEVDQWYACRVAVRAGTMSQATLDAAMAGKGLLS